MELLHGVRPGRLLLPAVAQEPMAVVVVPVVPAVLVVWAVVAARVPMAAVHSCFPHAVYCA